MNQNFSSQQLLKLCKQKEWEDYGLNSEELGVQIDENFTRIINDSFTFDFKKTGDYFLTDDLPQKLILRKLNDNIKRIYKDEQANRRVIIKQVTTLLSENGPMWILKTDIAKFYESINRERLISKIRKDSMISFHSLNLLDVIFQFPTISTSTGLPRGLNISATLSELYMRSFDKWIRRSSGVYYYARFVDDIIVFSNNEKTIKKIDQEINRNLEMGLKKKDSKTGIYNGDNIKEIKPLEYLGYKFTTKTNRKNKLLTTSIAESKIKKIKTRITHAFLDYIKNKDFQLLERRIMFLTGNYSVKRSIDGNDLKAGIYYNYSYLNDYSVLDGLNEYYRRTLFSRYGSFGRKIASNLIDEQKAILSKYSFKYGFLKKIYCSFTVEQMSEIKKCWK